MQSIPISQRNPGSSSIAGFPWVPTTNWRRAGAGALTGSTLLPAFMNPENINRIVATTGGRRDGGVGLRLA